MNIATDIDESTLVNCQRFQKPEVAKRYKNTFEEGHSSDQREKRAILRCLSRIPQHGHILDFPCGSGRLLNLLREHGFKVSGADSSPSMLKKTREEIDVAEIELHQSDVFNSGFADNEFDAVICNRLFHHLVESEDRVKALHELARISKGPVILSFFNTFSLSMNYRILRKKLKGEVLTDRLPVSFKTLREEIESCGRQVTFKTAKRWGISAMWYVIMEPVS